MIYVQQDFFSILSKLRIFNGLLNVVLLGHVNLLFRVFSFLLSNASFPLIFVVVVGFFCCCLGFFSSFYINSQGISISAVFWSFTENLSLGSNLPILGDLVSRTRGTYCSTKRCSMQVYYHY